MLYYLFGESLSNEKERLLGNVCYALVKAEELLPYCGHQYIPYSDILMGLQSKEVDWSSTLPKYDLDEYSMYLQNQNSKHYLKEGEACAITYKFKCSIKEAQSLIKKGNLKDLSELTIHICASGWSFEHETIPVTVNNNNNEKKSYVIKSEGNKNSLEKRIR